MELKPRTQLEPSSARLLRALLVLICITVTFLHPGYCPTGQANCDMEDMEESVSTRMVCLIACDVPLQATDFLVTQRTDSASLALRPHAREHVGRNVKPDLPPPRTLM
jgi:hypothetical protein